MSDWQSAPAVEDQTQPPAAQPAATWASAPAIGDEEKPTQSSKLDQYMAELKAPFKGETIGSLLKQNFFANMTRYVSRAADLQPDLEKQYDEGKANGTITEDFGPWMDKQLTAAYQQKYSESPPTEVPQVDWKALPKQIYDSATKHPALFVSEMAKSFIVDPELLVNPELGVASRAARAGVVAEKVARAGEVAATMGAQSAGISAGEQLSQGGTVQAAPVEEAAASGALTGLSLSMLHSALGLGVEAIARKKGATVTPEVKDQVQSEMQAAIDDGVAPTDALVSTLERHGLGRVEANRMGDAIDPYIEKEQSDAVQESQAGEVLQREPEEAGSGGSERERVQPGEQGEEAAAPRAEEESPQAQSEVTPTPAAEPGRSFTDPEQYKPEPPPELKTDYTVSADEAQQIFESAGMTPEEATKAVAKRTTIDGASLERKLAKFMGGDKYAEPVLRQFVGDRLNEVRGAASEANDIIGKVSEASKEGPPVQPPQPSIVSNKVPPERQIKVNIGARGQRTIVFPDEAHKDLFRLAAVLKRPNKRQADFELARTLGARAGAQFGTDVNGAVRAAYNYHDVVMDHARLNPEGANVAAPRIKSIPRSGKQGGQADPKVLAALGLAGIGGLAAYTLTGDKTKAIAAAAALGLLPFARSIVGRLRKGVQAVDAALGTDKRFDTKSIFRNYYRDVSVGNYAVDVWKRGIEAMLAGEPNIKASYTRIRDFTQGHDVALSPREQAAAGELRKFLDYMGQRGQNAKVLRQLIENYLPGLYQKKPFQSWGDVIDALTQNDAFRGNYTGMSPSSRHALQKVIPDYRTVEALIKSGQLDLVPLTDNPFEMASLYGKALNKTIANRTIVDTLKATPGPATRLNAKGDTVPIPLAVPITTRDAAARIAQGNAIKVKQLGLDPVDAEHVKEVWNRFDIMNAPRDYVTVSHPALEGLRVHRDVAQPLKLLFDTSDPGQASRALYALSMGAKSALFSFSLFHAGALATVGLTQALFRPGLWRGFGEARNLVLSKQFQPEVAHWLSHGLTLTHGVQDVDPSFFQRAVNLAEKYAQGLPLYTGMPALAAMKGIKFAHKAINDFMWGQLQPTLKLATAMAEEKRWLQKNSSGDRDVAARQIAEGVNTLYGGINWFELANNVEGNTARTLATALYSPQGRRWQQILMLSPDWLHASLRAWSEGAKAAMPGLDAKASDSLYRTYLLGSALTYLGAAQFLQQHYTGENIWDKPDWTYVDMGNGQKIQLNKHFMEAMHLLSNPGKFIVNKLNYIPKETLAQLFHKDYITVDKSGSLGGPPMQGSRVGHAIKSFASPISIQNLLQDPVSAVSGFFGVPIYGTSYEAQEARARAQARDAGQDEERAAARVQRRKARDEAQRHRE